MTKREAQAILFTPDVELDARLCYAAHINRGMTPAEADAFEQAAYALGVASIDDGILRGAWLARQPLSYLLAVRARLKEMLANPA